MTQLNSTQKDELIAQYVDLLVDSMSMSDLISYVAEDLTNFCDKLTDNELKEEISLTLDDETYDELVDNVTSEITVLNYNSVHDQIHKEATT
tara:strand:- start:102 stop:377 length:276 start_codon:yes stop_codon:yes gene_type:complete